MKLSSFLLTIFLLIGLFSFSMTSKEIPDCYVNFYKASKLFASTPIRLPAISGKTEKLQTENLEIKVSRVDGYQILYNNKKKAPFINLKVELSSSQLYAKDTLNTLNTLKDFNSQSENMETKDLMQLDYNGYKIYGWSCNSIDSSNIILGSFVMFPGNNIIIHFDFNNLKPALRNFKSLDDYKGQRNQFIGEYTSYLNFCLKK